ncbi:MAG TPA: tail fiber domain-containing protein [Polyangiaceae bacterium]|jgi:hypothetical protein|nr:tail fiber domain-containing protein [Polyangiaceae bacterium]
MINLRTAVRIPSLIMLVLAIRETSAHAQTQNTFFGTDAGISSTGDFNSGFGFQSLLSNTSGQTNTAMGWDSLVFNTTGAGNVAVGENVMRFNTTSSENTAIGHSAMLHNNATGNTGIGSGALESNTSGVDNVAVGYQALVFNTVGSDNTALGYSTLAAGSGVNARDNTAIGSFALASISNGPSNTAVGAFAMESAVSGNSNVAVGWQALSSLVNGTDNVAIGVNTLVQSDGGSNTAIGNEALNLATTGSSNVAVGLNAGISTVTGSNNVAVGVQAEPTGDFSDTVALGFQSSPSQNGDIRLGNNTSTTRIGGFQAYTNLSDARFKINVKENVPGLEFIRRLHPVTYNWDMNKLAEFDGNARSVSAIGEALREQNGRQLNTGFLAQQVEAAAKEIGYDFSGVSKPGSEKATYGLAYSEFVVPLVKAVQVRIPLHLSAESGRT